MNRTPPLEVRKQLRQEVGFGCPICGNPYLEWHHFNPPWNKKHHHNAEGMIALCAEHHKKADAGAYTIEQLNNYKNLAKDNNFEISGKFDWLRNNILAVVGGNFYYETLTIFKYKQQPIIWFNRDQDGYLLLNLKMLSTSYEERAEIIDNFWVKKGKPIDIESPPSGKSLSIKYSNGDYFMVNYSEVSGIDELHQKFSNLTIANDEIKFPITIVEINYKVANTGLNFSPKRTETPGNSSLINGFFSHKDVGIHID